MTGATVKDQGNDELPTWVYEEEEEAGGDDGEGEDSSDVLGVVVLVVIRLVLSVAPLHNVVFSKSL